MSDCCKRTSLFQMVPQGEVNRFIVQLNLLVRLAHVWFCGHLPTSKCGEEIL